MCPLHCEMRFPDLSSKTILGESAREFLEENSMGSLVWGGIVLSCAGLNGTRATALPLSLLGHEYWSFWFLNLETLGHTQVVPLFSGL